MVDRYAHFAAAVSNINQYVQRIESQKMRAYGLGGSCAQYLVAVHTRGEGLTMAALGEICQKDKAAVSRTVAQLEEKALVERRNQGSARYRSKIYLTKEGEKAAREVTSAACKAVELAGKGLTQAERETFYKALDLISGNLKTLLQNATEF